MTPISSMWPANITRGPPFPPTCASELPATSACTDWANRPASARQTRAGAASKAEGPGVSSSRLRNASDSAFTDRTVQLQLEKHRACDRVLPVRLDGMKAEPLVERDRGRHGWKGIQSHLAVAGFPRFPNDPFSQRAADLVRPESRADVQPLQLAVAGLQGPQGDTSGKCPIPRCQQQ